MQEKVSDFICYSWHGLDQAHGGFFRAFRVFRGQAGV